MAYLDPPPYPSPVIVQKDVGGLVSEYQARTEQYRREGREVRLHECRSACTMALSLPNVCVYPDSLLKFHKAYDWNTKVRDESASAQLFAYYPEPVQAKLGGLTREYRVLTGSELIAVGVRNCNADQIQIARAKPAPAPNPPATATPNIFGEILASLTSAPPQAPAVAVKASFAPARSTSALLTPPSLVEPAETMSRELVPLPPHRPADLTEPATIVTTIVDVPLPPKRPMDLPTPVPGLPELISGAQPTLPYGVLSYTAFGR